MADSLVRAILSNDCCSLPHILLFSLSLYESDSVSLAERFQVGLEAVRCWQQLCRDRTGTQQKIVSSFDCERSLNNYGALLGLFRVAALAIFIDKQPLMAPATAKRMALGPVDDLVHTFSKHWIDPLCALSLLLEIARLSNAEWETVSWIIEESHPETLQFYSFQETLRRQKEFMKSPEGATSFRQLCNTFNCIRELAMRRNM
jgi:hypothetical protein